jgi:hypothetical protein
MAKKIYINEEEVNKILAEIKSEITRTKCYGSVEIKKSFAQDNRKAIVYFGADAWNKVRALVSEFDTEVQWHGLVDRISENEFLVYDIVVPPHVVTGATVTSDETKYREWINALDDDTFNHLRFHGHSHVNMGCSPSNVDMTYRKDIVTQLPIPEDEMEDSFYIFMIFNKKSEWTGEIYDITNNALYSTKEIAIDVYCDERLLSDFIKEAKTLAIKETPKPVTPVQTTVTTTKGGKKNESFTYNTYTANGYSGTYKSYCDDDNDSGYGNKGTWWRFDD